MVKRFIVVCCLSTLLLAGAQPADAQSESLPRFEPAGCWFDAPAGETVECGYLAVPEDHARPDGPTIRLAVAIVRSHSADPAPDPVVYLAGGPGAGATGVAAGLGGPFALFLGTRDLILIDQRGTGFSEPYLGCPELDEARYELLAQDLPDDESLPAALDAVRACRDRLEGQGVNLAAYNSAQNAADIAALREALGYDALNLYGISYGTRLALTVMRDHPESVRSAVLDSTYPPQVNVYLDTLANTERVLTKLFDGCADDLLCNFTYPNLKQAYLDVYGRLQAEPLTIESANPMTGEWHTFVVDERLFSEMIFDLFYSAYAIDFLPALIYEMRAGHYDKLAALGWQPLISNEGISMGMFLSVQCSEEVPFTSYDEVTAAAGAFAPAMSGGRATSREFDFAACAVWLGDDTVANPIENEPVVSDIPALVLAGEYDPVTPPSFGRMAAEHLSNSYFYEFPGTDHGALEGGACPTGILLSFLNDPASAPDAGCIDDMGGPAFVLNERTGRPVARAAVVLLGIAAAGALGMGGAAIYRRRYNIAWWMGARVMGWVPAAVTAAALAFCLMLSVGGEVVNFPPLMTTRTVESVVPLAMGVVAAYLFSPEDEPPLEVLLASPRPVAWALFERLAVVVAVMGVIGLVGMGAAMAISGDGDVWAALVRWVPPAIFFVGLGTYITQSSRQAAFGVAALLVVWFVMDFIGDGLLPGREALPPLDIIQPFLWPVHVYLQPGALGGGDYALNRAVVALAGVGLMLLAARKLKDEEAVLLGIEKQSWLSKIISR